MRKRLVIVGTSHEGLELIPALEANPEVEVAAVVGENAEAARQAVGRALPAASPALLERVTDDLDGALALPGLVAVIEAEASEDQRARLASESEIQVTTPALARLLYAFGPIDAFTKSDLLHALREILESYDLALDRHGLLNRVLQIAVTATGADRGSLMLWDPNERALRVEVAIGIEELLLPKIRVHPGEGIAGRVFAIERPILLNGKADRDRYEITRERDDVESAISAPLLHGDQVIGVLNLSHGRDRDVFGDEDLQFVEQLARLDARLIARAEEYHGLRRESETLRAEARVRQLLAGSAPLGERLRSVCADLAAELRGVARLYLFDDEVDALVLQASSSGVDRFAMRERLRLGEGVVGTVARCRETAELRGVLGDNGALFVALPLSIEGKLFGVLSLDGLGGPRSTDLILARLRSAVGSLAEELAERLRAARLERSRSRQAQLTQIVARLGTCRDQESLAAAVTEEAASLLEAQDAVLRLREESSGRFRIVAWNGVGAWREASLAELEKKLAVDAIRAKGPLRIADLTARGELVSRSPGIGAAMVVPLLRAGRAIGSLSAMGKVPEEPLLGESFDAEDEAFLGQLAQHLQTALADLAQRAEVQRDSHYDAATGLPGAGLFRERLEEEVARSQRRGYALALLSVELRGFDELAEGTHAEAAEGAAVEVSHALREVMREFDVLGRETPARFVALLPEPDGEITAQVTALGRAARTALDARPELAANVELRLGYAVYPEDGANAEALLSRARELRVEAL